MWLGCASYTVSTSESSDTFGVWGALSCCLRVHFCSLSIPERVDCGVQLSLIEKLLVENFGQSYLSGFDNHNTIVFYV